MGTVLNKYVKNINIFPIKFSTFASEKKILYILHGQVFVMITFSNDESRKFKTSHLSKQ